MKNKEVFIGAIALLVIFFLYKFITERNNNNVSNKVDLGEFPVPQTTTISQKLSKSNKSYVSKLFSGDQNRIIQKVGEEAVELLIESKDNNKQKFIEIHRNK